jgi:N-acyl-D-amino-acid deacylase
MSKLSRRKFIQAASITGASTILLGGGTINRIFASPRGFDLLIKNGMIIDGTGKAEFMADIGIKNGKIEAIGNLSEAEGINIINGKGLKVTPGFIDIHSHTDVDLLINPKAESKIRQGVTTEVCGQDGSSWGPRNPEKKNDSFKALYGEEISWITLGDFLDHFSTKKFSVNLASMLGLGTIREVVVGYDDRPASPIEMERMREEVKRAINEGAVGLSTGLEYTPGSFASTEELIELCKAAPSRGRLYSTHMRNEDNTVLEAIEEAIRIAEESESSLLISHLKVSGKSNWHKAHSALELMEDAAMRGVHVHADRYTYVAYHTGLANLYPLWARDGGSEKFIERFQDKALLDSMKQVAETKISNLDGGWKGVVISAISSDKWKQYQGKSVKEIAEAEGMSEFEASTAMIKDSGNSVMMVGFGMEEKSTETILAHPLVMIASDGGSHAPYPPMTRSIAHPRSYGTFPRAIGKYVRERKICSLEEMIKKMTSMPADKLNIKERGRLEKGKAADIVLFDFNTIIDKATFTDPHQYPAGIPYVIVNGEIVINEGEHTGNMPGKVIKGA